MKCIYQFFDKGGNWDVYVFLKKTLKKAAHNRFRKIEKQKLVISFTWSNKPCISYICYTNQTESLITLQIRNRILRLHH